MLQGVLFPLLAHKPYKGADATLMGKGYTDLSIPQAKRLLKQDPRARLVDTRSIAEYRNGSLPGSIFIPESDIDRRAPLLLPDRSAPVLVFCRTGACSWRSAQRFVELGYSNVFNVGGYLEWKLVM